MSTLMLELEKMARQTKQNYQDVLASQYVSLCHEHGVKMTLEESREALTRLGYISVEGKDTGRSHLLPPNVYNNSNRLM